MSQELLGSTKSFPNTAALLKFRRVVISAGVLAYASAYEFGLGVLQQTMFASTNSLSAPVRLPSSEGTMKMTAAGAITAYAWAYAAANGKVAATGVVPIGMAMEASSNDGDIIEILPFPSVPAASATGAITITPAADSGAGSTIPASATEVVLAANTNDANDWFTLPPIADVPIGHRVIISIAGGANCEMRTPASSNTKINNVDSDGTQEYLCTSTDVVIAIKRTATDWIAQSLTLLGAVRTAVVPD